MGISHLPALACILKLLHFSREHGMAARQAAARPLSSCQNKYFNFRDLYYLSPLLLTDCAFVASILRSKPPQAQIFEVHSNQRPIMPNWTILIP